MIEFEVDVQAPSIEHDPMMIEALVKLYHKKPSLYWESYQEGMQAGIRYTLLALDVKIDGINKWEGGSSK